MSIENPNVSGDSRVEMMRCHGPGWELDFSTRDESGEVIEPGSSFWLWAPQDGSIIDPYGFAKMQDADWSPRDHWAACWQSADGLDGDFVKGTSADVLTIFEPKIRSMFESALEGSR